MQIRRFGNTDLTASAVGFGTWTVTTGWWQDHSEEEAVALIQRAVDLGVTFIDTADNYGEGYGETFVAKALKGQRDKLTLSTKFGYDFYNNKDRRGQEERPQVWTPAYVRFSLEESLKRLETDRIDLWQLHNAKMDAILDDDLWATLLDLKAEGKVRHIGVALGPRIGWPEEGITALLKRPITALHVIYSILEQDPGRDFVLHCPDTCGIMVRVPHSSGMLEGRYTKDTVFPPNDHRRHRPHSWLLEGVEKVETLRFLEQEHAMTMGQASIQWLLAQPRIATVLPNIYDVPQLEEFAAAPGKEPLTAHDLFRIRALYDQNFGVVPAGLEPVPA